MGLISRRFRFLQNLFPPGGALPPQPGFFEESISPVHQVLNGTDRLGEYFTFISTGSAGTATVTSGGAPNNKYWFVFSGGLSHNDPTARDANLKVNVGGVGDFVLGHVIALPTNLEFGLSRSIILPPRAALRANVPAIGGAQTVSLRFLYLELDLGEPAPPSP